MMMITMMMIIKLILKGANLCFYLLYLIIFCCCSSLTAVKTASNMRIHMATRTTIPGITTKENQSEAVLRALALEEIDKHYPAATWTQIYTDGSTENATRNRGCGAYIKRPDKPPLSVSAPGGILCSNYRAEVLALLNATETIISWEEKPKKAVFLTDSLSALQALMSDEPDTTQKKLTENINTLTQTTYVVLQWIPAHTGIRGNKMVDQVTKKRKGNRATPITSVLQRSQNSYP